MSESVKPRFAVDLNEIEQQIAQAQSAPSQAAPAGRSDPLAELARIVGQDDPFQSILSNDAPARPRNQASSSLDDLFATRDEIAAAPRAAQPQQARHEVPDFDFSHYVQPQARQSAEPAYGYQPAPPVQAHDGYGDAAYDQGYYDENAPQAVHGYGRQDDEGYEPIEKPRSRKGLVVVGAIAGAIVLGAGGAYLLSGGASSVTGGEPPLVTASKDPVKVQPQNPGGVEIPNQNKQIYERANQSTETKVVNREEQPVDVHQAARMNAGASADATGATASSRNGLNLGEPKKVRTVSIRPDGSVAQPEGKPAPAPVPVPAMTMPAAAQPGAAQPAPPKPAASTPPVVTAAKPAPVAEPAPQKVASAQPMAPAAPAAAPEVTSTGGFSVQLGVRSSEAEAQTAFQQFQKKYAELGSAPSLIRKAEVNGNTVYRVRVGPMSREEASSLCSKLQGQGGQCFVAKN